MSEIRIPDLRDPRRDTREQTAYDFALGLEVDLDPAGLVREAVHISGLDDFGDPGVLHRLAAQAAAVDADDGLSGLGRFIIRRRLVGLLTARLRFEDYTRRHPEALEVELEEEKEERPPAQPGL